MPEFGTPFAGNTLGRPLSTPELVRAIRFAIAAEAEAIQMYQQMAESSVDEQASEVLRDIAAEEQVHIGELQAVLFRLDPSEKKAYDEGKQEVDELSDPDGDSLTDDYELADDDESEDKDEEETDLSTDTD